MKYTTLKEFEQSLKQGAQSSVYLLIGKDPFELRMAVEALLPQLLSGEKDPKLCTKTFDGEGLNIGKVLGELETIPFFVKKQVVHVRAGENLKIDAIRKLERYCENPNPTSVLVVTANTLAATTNFYKKAVNNNVVLHLTEEKPWQQEKSFPQWIGTHAVRLGKKIDQKACHDLFRMVGADRALLHQELEKLACYVGERTSITSADVAAVSCGVNIDTIWQLGDALFSRQVGKALQISKGLLEETGSIIGLLRQLRGQFETKMQICSILVFGGSPQNVTEQYPYMRGQILQRHIQLAQGYGIDRCKQGLLLLDEAELTAKNSSINQTLLADTLIVKLAK